jgi:hypothetical protein
LKEAKILKVIKLFDFLNTANLGISDVPALVHSTPAANIYNIAEHRRIRIFNCDVFSGEKLCYLFVGRPAFKWTIETDASYWQCPLVFVFRDLSGIPIKRIHPFDSAAFVRKRFPEYITMFPLNRFELGAEKSIIPKLIAAFHGDLDRYMRGDSLSLDAIKAQFSLTPRHQEIEALIRLYNDRSARKHDDRRSCIEIQISHDLNLSGGNLLGVVLPDAYKSDVELIETLRALDCKIEPYDIYPLRVDSYYSQIYDLVKKIQREASP